MKPPEESASNTSIGKLPADVICLILTFLPIKQAVRTSILSTQWRHRWRRIPQLVFDEDFATISAECNPQLNQNSKVMLEIYQALLKELILPTGFYEGFLPLCPLLQELRVVDHNFNNLKPVFAAPSLKLLFFHSYFESIYFKNTPRLSVISILDFGEFDYTGCDDIFKQYNPDMVTLFASLPALEELNVGFELLLVSYILGFPYFSYHMYTAISKLFIMFSPPVPF
ncbi:F-box/FBD/LRR-repeat protein At1g13570 [Linum perenne]